MAIVERVKGICLKPDAEWGVIAEESTSTADLFKRYAIPLAAIGPIAGFIGGSLVGRTVPFVGTFRMPFGAGLTMAVTTFVMMLVGVFVLSLIVNALAPTFGGEKNSAQALKVAVYAYTPAWIAGVLQLLPSLGLLGLIAGLYGVYLLYLGLPRLMKSPKEKAIAYTAVVVVCAVVLTLVVGAIGAAVAGTGLPVAASSEVKFDKDSALGKLQNLGKAMEQSSKKMEAAQKSGDPNAQAAAAMEQLGVAVAGGKRVDPVGIDQLKPFVPDKLAGLEKLSSNAEKAGVAGLMISKASATYGDRAKKKVLLDVSDTGGASGMLALAGWARVEGEREDDNGFERTSRVDGRLVHEKGSKRGGQNEFTIVIANRFIVSAKGRGVEVAELKAAVSSLDLGKLDALKDVGVQK